MSADLTAKDNAPCLNCERRRVGCHGSCEDYARADKLRREEKDRIRRAKADYGIYMAYISGSAAAKKSRDIKKKIQKRG